MLMNLNTQYVIAIIHYVKYTIDSIIQLNQCFIAVTKKKVGQFGRETFSECWKNKHVRWIKHQEKHRKTWFLHPTKKIFFPLEKTKTRDPTARALTMFSGP